MKKKWNNTWNKNIKNLNMEFFKFFGFKKKPKAPWKKYYKKEDMDLNIPDISLYNYFEKNAMKYGEMDAIDYYGTKINFKELLEQIDECAKSFYYSGIRPGDVVTICMPNTPEGVIAFFALNKIGAISNMVHPLSSENEIKNTLINTYSIMLVLIDMDYSKIKNIIKDTNVLKVIVVKANNSMPLSTSLGYSLTIGRKIELPKNNKLYTYWNDFVKSTEGINIKNYIHNGRKNSPAVMLHSGGSTGTPKAVVLSNNNVMAFTEQGKIVLDELEIGDTSLAIMPIFHGFGLVTCIYSPLCLGVQIILLPKFNPQEFKKLLNKHKPEFIMGVPTMFETLSNIKDPKFKIDYLKYAISGGDVLKKNIETNVNNFLEEHGSKTKILQAYGMSESVSAIAFGRKNNIREGTIGIPFPGVYVGIFSSDDKELPYGEEGEICISGPNVMLGYYNNVKETNIALHIHKDGNIWLHSGDLGIMDKDGFLTYTSRLKRMIISSGYNVYPSQIEELLESHPAVMLCSVVGIPHKYKLEVPKAYIVLNKGFLPIEPLISELKNLCSKNLPKYAQPYKYEFRKSLPKTIVGKIDFRSLQEENIKNRNTNLEQQNNNKEGVNNEK